MFNFWNYFFFFISIILVIFLLNFKTPLKALFLSELNWIVLITNSIIMASFNNDPRFFLITFVFLFLAAVEIVLYLLNFNFKN